MIPTYAQLQALLRAHNFAFFGAGAYNLNLVLLRAKPGQLDAYDDLLACAWIGQDGRPRAEAWACTADPGRAPLEAPPRADGVAQLALGQHRRALTFGTHRGAYRCLSAVGPLPVLRYLSVADFLAGRGASSTAQGIQVHRAGEKGAVAVGPWSEGCPVLPRRGDLEQLMGLCDAQAAAGFGDRFTITVLERPSDL